MSEIQDASRYLSHVVRPSLFLSVVLMTDPFRRVSQLNQWALDWEGNLNRVSLVILMFGSGFLYEMEWRKGSTLNKFADLGLQYVHIVPANPTSNSIATNDQSSCSSESEASSLF